MRYYQYPFRELDSARIFSAFCEDPYALFFDSCDAEHPLSQCSYICLDPVETIETRQDRVIIRNEDHVWQVSGNPFDIVRERMSVWSPDGQMPSQTNGVHPFKAGAAGFFGYDLGRTLEQLPVRASRNEDMPDMCIGIYQTVLAFHHQSGKNILYILCDNDDEAQQKSENIFSRMRCSEKPVRNTSKVDMRPTLASETLRDNIQKVIQYIYAGDIFQANISLRFEGIRPGDFNAYAHYLALREKNKAPFAAFLNYGNIKIASVSPESFLSCNGGHVKTRPIKGTSPRFDTEQENMRSVLTLQNDEKSRAENAMIVDLMRNDLSRVCNDYSINVPQLFKVESYARVNHLVSEVCGDLRLDKSPTDLLKACFPGGSITGAPKIRAMEIIEELEEKRRGPYCGSLGFIDFDGTMETNIAIRTIIHHRDKISMNVGAGIVADSLPENEYQEILSKARGMLESFDNGEGGKSRCQEHELWVKSA